MQFQALQAIDQTNIENIPFPVKDVLEDSLYYPASGVDGTPIRNWSLGVNSFVYVDLSRSQANYLNALANEPIRGYHMVAQKAVRKDELVRDGFSSAPPACLSRRDFERAMQINGANPGNAFALWSVFERDQDRDEAFGAHRFSLLHLRADGVAAYDALFRSNDCLPRILAFIRPGLGFGGNYRTYAQALIEVMQRSPRGLPPQLLWEHPMAEEPELDELWSQFYTTQISGPLGRDGPGHYSVSLFER